MAKKATKKTIAKKAPKKRGQFKSTDGSFRTKLNNNAVKEAKAHGYHLPHGYGIEIHVVRHKKK
jgi:hypothetical protein